MMPFQTAWLFSLGEQSVRIVRVGAADRPKRLLVDGPGNAEVIFEQDDLIGLTFRHEAIERTLILEGYRLVHLLSAERRTGAERRATPRGAPSDRRKFRSGPYL